MKTSLALGIAGFSLIGVTYGMARFAWGLMLPDVAQAIPFSSRLAGVLSACSFAAYCLSILAAPLLARRLGSRLPAAAAALCAAAGLAILALAVSPLMLGVGLFIAGLSPGLASPSLADAVSRLIAERRQSQMNTLINAGTGAGIILSVPVLFYLPGGWRAACGVFAVLALACLFPTLRCLPAGASTHHEEQPGCGDFLNRPMLRLTLIGLISGAASAAWWSFGPQILHQQLHAANSTVSTLWLISGGAGILGVLAGPAASVIGLRQVYRLSLLGMAIPLLLLAVSQHVSGWLYPAVGLGGLGYITLSGVLLVCGAQAVKRSPAGGVGVVFFMLAAGQVIGSVIFGLLCAQAGAVVALLAFAGCAAAMLLVVPETENR